MHPKKLGKMKGVKLPLLLLRSCPPEGVSSSVKKTVRKNKMSKWETKQRKVALNILKWWLNCLFLAFCSPKQCYWQSSQEWKCNYERTRSRLTTQGARVSKNSSWCSMAKVQVTFLLTDTVIHIVWKSSFKSHLWTKRAERALLLSQISHYL